MKNSEPAFPVIDPINKAFTKKGLSKREYFAGLAMQGLMSNPDYGLIDIAKESIAIADRLLEQLEK